MSGVNKVILVGNLGNDPEIRALENGVKVANFNIATNEVYKDKDGNKQERTEWHRIVLWRGLAEIAENYLKKGNQVYIEGKLRTRQWEDKDGVKKYTTEVQCDNMTMLGGKSSGTEGSTPLSENDMPKNHSAEAEAGDDLPF